MEKEIKLAYITPEMKRVEIDSEISLALESPPPVFETKNQSHSTDYFNQHPLNT